MGNMRSLLTAQLRSQRIEMAIVTHFKKNKQLGPKQFSKG